MSWGSEFRDSLCQACSDFSRGIAGAESPLELECLWIGPLNIFLTVNLADSRSYLAWVTGPSLSADRQNRSMPAGWDNASIDGNLWLDSRPCLKLHAPLLTFCLSCRCLVMIRPRNKNTDKMNYYPQFHWTVNSNTSSFITNFTVFSVNSVIDSGT